MMMFRTKESLVATFEKMMKVDTDGLMKNTGPSVVESPMTPMHVVRTKAPPSAVKMRMLEMQYMEGSSTTPWEMLCLDMTK